MDALGNSKATSSVGIRSETRLRNINILPNELLVEIFCKLDPVQLGIVRLVCHRWNHAVSDKTTWISAFNGKFGTPMWSFPTVSGSSLWMVEYLARLQVFKKWNKGTAIHKTYQLINNEFRGVDAVFVNFSAERLLTFSRRTGNVALCNLDGRNEGFIPGGNALLGVLSYDVNESYLVIGKANGVFAKNIRGGSAYELTEKGANEPATTDTSSTISILLNSPSRLDKHKIRPDIIAGTLNGTLRLYNLSSLTSSIYLGDCILNIKSDFKRFVIVNTKNKLYIIKFDNLEILARLDIPEIETNHETILNIGVQYGAVSPFRRNQLDVDFAYLNVIYCYRNVILVYDILGFDSDIGYREDIPKKSLHFDGEVIQSTMQVQTKDMRQAAGRDGLLYANVLSDNSVVVWNIRDWSSPEIIPQCKIIPEFNKNAPDTSRYESIRPITAISINSSIAAIASYNGYLNIHDVFTGDFIREGSVKIPKRYVHMYTELIPVDCIVLSDNQVDATGVIVSGDIVQYFQFGHKYPTTVSKKKLNYGVWDKQELKKKIQDELSEFDSQRWVEQERNALFDKYNGNSDEDELAIALALSESVKVDGDTDVERAIQESRRMHLERGGHTEEKEEPIEGLPEEEQLRRILELSLHEQ